VNQVTVVNLVKNANAKIVLDTIKFMKKNLIVRLRDAASMKNVVNKEIVVREGKFVSASIVLPSTNKLRK
jgi:hypothetical protein